MKTKITKLVRSFYLYYYCQQRSCGKVIFSQASVSHSVHRGRGRLAHTTPNQTPPPGRHTIQADTPQADTPQADTPPVATASYWNAFLYLFCFTEVDLHMYKYIVHSNGTNDVSRSIMVFCCWPCNVYELCQQMIKFAQFLQIGGKSCYFLINWNKMEDVAPTDRFTFLIYLLE